MWILGPSDTLGSEFGVYCDWYQFIFSCCSIANAINMAEDIRENGENYGIYGQ